MAPWPEQGIEPKAPDKTSSKSSENSPPEEVSVSPNPPEDNEESASGGKLDEKQTEKKRKGDVSNLNDGQLKALLDEALTYKCPKDREGKSNLFIELLAKAESNKPECGATNRGNQGSFDPGTSSRYYSSRRRGRKDASATVSEQTRGGSLQNLVQAYSNEFDSSFSYLNSSQSGARSRRSKRGSKEYGVSVSARQREGGSLPSNVNVGGSGVLAFPGQDNSLSSAATAALLFDGFQTSETQKFASKYLKCKDSVHTGSEPKIQKTIKDQGHCTTELKPAVNKDQSYPSWNEFKPRKERDSSVLPIYSFVPGSDLSTITKLAEIMPSEYVAINIPGNDDESGNKKEASQKLNDEHRVSFAENGNPLMCDEGTEMELFKKNDVVNYTTRATLEVGLGDGKKARTKEQDQDVDHTIRFPLLQSEKPNGVEQNPLQLGSSYNAVNCFLGPSERNGPTYPLASSGSTALSNALRVDGTKIFNTNVLSMQHVSVLALPPNNAWIAKALAPDTGKSFDENGNAVSHGHRDYNNGNERKSKTRRTKTNNDRNVVMSQNIEGHRGDKDIDSLLEFIESDKERKVKTNKNSTSHPIALTARHRSSNIISSDKGAKSRDRKLHKEEQHIKGENNKLKKTNSLEEISKTKLEDLTSERTGVLRKPKKQSTMDDADLSRVGDRRSWGTDEGQQYYFNDPASADENFPSSRKKRRGEIKDDGYVPALSTEETDFHVVTKKQRRKKRTSSSGGKGGLFDENRQNQYNPQQRDRCDSYQRRGNSGFPPHDRDVLYQYHRPITPDLRRKSASSMPPSDKSDSSDLDSVHSLPVSSTTPKLSLDQTSTSSGSTPQASYADIAKITSANPTNINVSTTKWPAITGSNPNPNPQFITCSKVNIGVPPVSGKVATNPVPSVASSIRSDDGEEPEVVMAHVEPSLPTKPLDPRPKKNAVINTPVDIKVIPPYQTDDKSFTKQVVENSSNKVIFNNLQIEISDRIIKVSPAINPRDVVFECKPETVTKIGKSLMDIKSEVIERAVAAPLEVQSVAIGSSVVVAGLPTGEHFMLTGEGAELPNSKVAKSDLYDNKSNVKFKDSSAKTGKVNIGSKKPSASLSRTARPAVIILDEKESVFVSQNSSASDITFGFEVNELLLMSDGEESFEGSGFNCLNTCENQVVDRTVNSAHSVEPNVCEPVIPANVDQHVDPNVCETRDTQSDRTPSLNCVDQTERECSAGRICVEFESNSIRSENEKMLGQAANVDEFFARFKTPVTQLTESHAKIVNLVGLAWADVMLELDNGGNVKFYDGQ